MRRSGHSGQLVPGAEGDLDAAAPGQGEQLLKRRAPAVGEDGHLVHAPALGPQ